MNSANPKAGRSITVNNAKTLASTHSRADMCVFTPHSNAARGFGYKYYERPLFVVVFFKVVREFAFRVARNNWAIVSC